MKPVKIWIARGKKEGSWEDNRNRLTFELESHVRFGAWLKEHFGLRPGQCKQFEIREVKTKINSGGI
jgi:hypothetical protein